MLVDDRVVLMDFGLARPIEDGPIDRSGTPSYMSGGRFRSSITPACPDAHHLSYCDSKTCGVLDVTTGARRTLPLPARLGINHLTASSDGIHWYSSPLHAEVSLHEVVNFRDRPWAD